MASRNNNPRPSGERSRVRVVGVEFEGASNDLQQLAQTRVNAVKAPPPIVITAPPALPNGTQATRAALGHASNGEQRGLFDEVAEVEQVTVEQAHQPMQVPAAKPQNAVRKKQKLRTPAIISELEFDSGEKSLEGYFQEQQSPEEHSKRYLVFAQWLKVHRSITEVGADHMYTCYRALSLSIPDDVLSVFRGLKKQGWVEAGSERGTFKINHIGEKQLLNATRNKE